MNPEDLASEEVVRALHEIADDPQSHAGLPHCDRCGALTGGTHSCPFQEEIYDNHNPQHCNCCADCRYQCSQDI